MLSRPGPCAVRLIAGLVLLGALALPARAGDEPADAELRAKIVVWLDELRSDEYAVREAARASLVQHGLSAPDLLEARLDDPDAEVRRTVKRLLDRVAPTPERPEGAIDQIGLVTLAANATSLREVLLTFGDFELPAGHDDAFVAGEPAQGPYFGVLRALLARTGLQMPKPFDAAGRASLDALAEGVEAPWTSAGPLEVTATEVTATRPLTGSGTPHYAITLEVRWAPHVQVVQIDSPRIVRAEDREGRAFVGTAGTAITRYGVSYMQTSRTLQVGLRPSGAGGGEALATLALKLRLQLRHGRRVVRFSGLDEAAAQGIEGLCLDADGNPVERGTAGSVELVSIERDAANSRPQWVVDLVATLPDELPRSTAYVVVTWTDGQRSRLHVMGGRSQSADGTLRLTARANPQGEATPRALDVFWFESETEGELDIELKDVPLR